MGGELDLGRIQELVDREQPREPEAGVREDAGIAREGGGIARDIHEALEPAAGDGRTLGPGAGPRRIEDDEVETLQFGRFHRLALQIAPEAADRRRAGGPQRAAHRHPRIRIAVHEQEPGETVAVRQREDPEAGMEIEQPIAIPDRLADEGGERPLTLLGSLEKGRGRQGNAQIPHANPGLGPVHQRLRPEADPEGHAQDPMDRGERAPDLPVPRRSLPVGEQGHVDAVRRTGEMDGAIRHPASCQQHSERCEQLLEFGTRDRTAGHRFDTVTAQTEKAQAPSTPAGLPPQPQSPAASER